MRMRIEFRYDDGKVDEIWEVDSKLQNFARWFGVEQKFQDVLDNNGTIIFTKGGK